MKLSLLKIDSMYKYLRDGGKCNIKYLGMDGDKYKFVPLMSNGKQYGVSNGLTESEVKKYVQV